MSTATVPAGSGTAQAPATSRRRLLAAGLLLPAAALAVTGAGFSAAGPVPGPDAVGLSLAVTWADLLTAAAAVAGALVVALWLHLPLAVPDGRLPRRRSSSQPAGRSRRPRSRPGCSSLPRPRCPRSGRAT